MSRQPTRRLGNGAPRRAAKRQRNKNSRWMHLSASAIGTRQLVQRCWARHTVAATTSIFLAAYATVLQLIANQPAVSQAIQPCVDYLVRQSSLFVQHIQYWRTTDSLLYDIPLVEWLQTREYHPRQHLRIGDIANDMTAMKMTSFNINQLSRIYHHLPK